MIQFTINTFIWFMGCLALGIGYSYLLYRSPVNVSASLQKILFALRTIAVTVLAFLLVAPLIKKTSHTVEKPLIILAQDNSASIGIAKQKGFNPTRYSNDFKALATTLSDKYEIRSFNFGNRVSDGLDFLYNGRSTNINALFNQIKDRFANRNIGAIILASDGLYNQGGNPQYEIQDIKAPVYTIALGDTVPRKDLLIANVNYNNMAYLGNQFRIEVSLEAFLSKGANTVVKVSDRSGVIFSKPVNIQSNEYRQSIPVILDAKSKGIQKYTITASPVSGELSRQNNTQVIYVEVIDGRKKVLILANSPHPDIAALKQSIEINKNYEVKVALAINAQPSDIDWGDIIILHQLPSLTNGVQMFSKQLSSRPLFFILGSQSNTQSFSVMQPMLGITSPGAAQEALAHVRKDFYAFTLSGQTVNKLANFAPLLAPFGNYSIKGNASVLLDQQIGKVVTNMPLMIFGESAPNKIAILTGEGIWRWRLEEFRESGTHDAVNELVSKTLQYLSVTDDKRKFRAYAAKKSFDENEHIILNAELYNDAYELINTPDVRLALKSSTGKNYSYIFTRTGNAYLLDAGILPPAEYEFTASTRLGNTKHQADGRFIISGESAELKQTVANHQLLYSLADQSGGKMIFPSQLSKLAELINSNENIKSISFENRKYEELLDLKLIFFLVLGLLSAEWFLRKRNGEI